MSATHDQEPREATAGGVTEAAVEAGAKALALARSPDGMPDGWWLAENRRFFQKAIAAALPHIARPAGDVAEMVEWLNATAKDHDKQASDGRSWDYCAPSSFHAAEAVKLREIAAAIAALAEDRDAARNDLQDTFVDENGLAWSRPTAWAYYAVCKVRDAYQIRHDDLAKRALQAEAERDQARRELDVQQQHVRSAIERAGRYQAERDALAAQIAEYQRTLADPVAVGVNIRRGTIARPADLVWLHDSEGPVAELEAALREIKLLALTAGGKGQISTPAALSRMVRLCIDAGIVEHLPQLAEKRP